MSAVNNILSDVKRTNTKAAIRQEKGAKEKLEELEKIVLKEKDNEVRLSMYIYFYLVINLVI